MIFPVKRVKEELINEFAVSKMDIETFSQMHSIQPEALRSWIQEKMYRSQHPESESPDIFQASEFGITTRNFWRVVNLILNSNLFVHIEQTSLKLYNYLHDNN